MKIYFAGSIRGGRNDQHIYDQLIKFMQENGIDVLCEHFAYRDKSEQGLEESSRHIHDRDLAWVKQADAVVAEVTNPSLGVGYEIGKATEWGKPVLALFRQQPDKSLSAMIDGSPGVTSCTYKTVQDACKYIEKFLSSIR